jgi:hypothetical protein
MTARHTPDPEQAPEATNQAQDEKSELDRLTLRTYNMAAAVEASYLMSLRSR